MPRSALEQDVKMFARLLSELDGAIQPESFEKLATLSQHMSKAIEQPYSLPISSLDREDTYSIFSLKDDQTPTEEIWSVDDNQIFKVPELIVGAFAMFQRVVGFHTGNEALIRAKLNLLLLCSIEAEQTTTSGADTSVSPETAKAIFTQPLRIEFEKHLEKAVNHQGKMRLLNGFCDYSIWYESEDQLGTNLIIYEAKKSGLASYGANQCLTYMAIVHQVRKAAGKANSTVFGVSTDAEDYYFLRIDNHSRVSRYQLSWLTSPNRVYSTLRMIARHAASLSPTTSATVATSEGGGENLQEKFNVWVRSRAEVEGPIDADA